MRSSPGDSWTPCWDNFPNFFQENVSRHRAIAGSAALAPVGVDVWFAEARGTLTPDGRQLVRRLSESATRPLAG